MQRLVPTCFWYVNVSRALVGGGGGNLENYPFLYLSTWGHRQWPSTVHPHPQGKLLGQLLDGEKESLSLDLGLRVGAARITSSGAEWCG